MWFLSSRKTRRPIPARRRPLSYRPRLEAMEDRCCPSGGLLNPGFGNGGIDVNIPTNKVAVQSNGDIITASGTGGYRESIVVTRVTPSGALDTTFNGSGTVTISIKGTYGSYANTVLLQSDGKILVGGAAGVSKFNADSEFVVARLNSDGTMDKSFGRGGLFTWSPTSYQNDVRGLALLSNGDILATGKAQLNGDSYALFRLTPGGALDTTFGNQGNGLAAVHVGIPSNTADGPSDSIVLAPNGDILLCGSDSKGDADLVAFTSQGTVDTTFGGGNGWIEYAPPAGYSAYAFSDMVLQGSQLVVAGQVGTAGPFGGTGTWYGVVSRYSLAGVLDPTFATSGYYITSFLGGLGPVAVAADGSIIVAGVENYLPTGSTTYASEMVVGHLSANGVPDTTFGSDGSGFVAIQAVANGVSGMALDGAYIVLAGNSTLVEVTAP